jgi:hypothetical protein
MMALTGSERNAISRALARGGAGAVERVRYGRYRVASTSRAGRFHTVTVDARGRYRCDCEAGRAGRVCWAQAAVYIAKLEHASEGRARVTGTPSGRAAGAPAPPANVTPLRRAA